MLDRIQRWLSIDTMLPVAERLGPVGTTKQLYGNYLKITLLLPCPMSAAPTI